MAPPPYFTEKECAKMDIDAVCTPTVHPHFTYRNSTKNRRNYVITNIKAQTSPQYVGMGVVTLGFANAY